MDSELRRHFVEEQKVEVEIGIGIEIEMEIEMKQNFIVLSQANRAWLFDSLLPINSVTAL